MAHLIPQSMKSTAPRPCHYVQAKHEEARRLYERSLGISEKNLGASHPAIAGVLNDMAESLLRQVKSVTFSKSFSLCFALGITKCGKSEL